MRRVAAMNLLQLAGVHRPFEAQGKLECLCYWFFSRLTGLWSLD